MVKGIRVEMDEEKLSNEVNGVDKDCVKEGMKVEEKEHPSFNAKQIKTIVTDHLKMDPKYYEKEEKEK